jgi:predicted Zn-dependent protease
MKSIQGLLPIRSIVILLISCIIAAANSVSFAGSPARFRDDAHARGDRSPVAQSQVERLRRVMLPLLRATNHPRRYDQIQVKIVEDPSINAASAGNGEFYVTTGLLNKANDDQLRGVLAHEIAHDDLGHPAKAQVLGAGLGLGVMLLEQFIPGSNRLTPIAGTLIARSYSRPQEYEADRHAVEILRRAGYSKDVMIGTLSWLMRAEGNSGGGILSTHPATSDRIRMLKQMR